MAFRAGAYSAESCREKWVSLVGRRRGARRLAGRPLSTFPDLRTYVTYSEVLFFKHDFTKKENSDEGGVCCVHERLAVDWLFKHCH